MNEQTEITRLIIATVLQHLGILGSQLGARVKQAFPSFKGLKYHIDHYCAGEVICVRKHGPDYVYAHVSQVERKMEPVLAATPILSLRTEPIIPQPQPFFVNKSANLFPAPVPGHTAYTPQSATIRPIPRPVRNVTPWSAFTNPGIEDRLALDLSTQEIQTIPLGHPIQPPVAEIPKVSSDEHHKIACEFLPMIDTPDRPQFQQAPGVAIMWSSWSWQIKQFAGGKYFSLWLDFRTQSLRQLLADRIAKLGVDTTAAESILNKVIESKRRASPPRPEVISDFGGPQASSGQVSMSELELRRIAAAAISEMNVEELRRLCFPLGVILNALTRNAS